MKVSMHNKDVRRESARKRFKLLSFVDWAKSRDVSKLSDEDRRVAYSGYQERKQSEAVSLGLKGA